jgi:hypothetical protein
METQTEIKSRIQTAQRMCFLGGSTRGLQCQKYGTRISVVPVAVCCKPEGHGFETRGVECFFFLSIFIILPAALGPGVYSASNRNEYQKQKGNVSEGYSTAGAYG